MRVARALLWAVALASAGLVAAPAARAQMAEALGKPLPREELPAGTVSVRLVEGNLSRPVASADVILTVGGETRIARTDASGRALFPGLPPGATVQAAVGDVPGVAEVPSIQSEVFTLPADRGVAVLLSTAPFAEGAMGGRPEPRRMAGQPRPERDDPAGQISVRLSYNDLDRLEGLADRPVVLVAYAADERVAAKVVKTDGAGRAIVPALDTSGNTAYYALASLPRDGQHDRLMSLPMMPGREHGVRVLLSGEKQEGGAPRIDDLERFIRQPELPAGQVIVAIGGELPAHGEVELFDVVRGEVVATAPIGRGRAIPSSIDVTFGDPHASERPGEVALHVVVTAGGQRLGLPRAPVTVQAVGDGGAFLATAMTDNDGRAAVDGAPAGVRLEAVVEVQGKRFASAPFQLAPAHGVVIDVPTRFELLSLVEAAFEGVAPTPEGAYLAQTTIGSRRYRTPPFQVLPERGVVAPLFVLPRPELTFQLDAVFEDDYLAVRGNYQIQNASWAPWAGPSEGLRVTTPRGARGLVVADVDKDWVAVDGGAFRLTRPVPPLGGEFRAAFSLPVDGGGIEWDLALPYGTSGSSMAILQTDGMKVELPPRVQGRPIRDPGTGRVWFAIQRIEIPKGHRMVFTIRGLPERPAWMRVSRKLAGGAVLLVLIAGVAFAVWRRGGGAPSEARIRRDERRGRIDALLEQIAAIERGQGEPARREALMAELEELYAEEASAPPTAAGGARGAGGAGA
jgi:hypothetical protein